jgi:hypothetical protein
MERKFSEPVWRGLPLQAKAFDKKEKTTNEIGENLSEHGLSHVMTMPPLCLRRNEAYQTTVLDTPFYPSGQRKEESAKTSRTIESHQDLGREARPRMPKPLLPTTDYLASTLKKTSNATTEFISHQV